TDDMCYPEIHLDAEISFNQINGKFKRVLAQMGPFGPQNPEPIFLTRNVSFTGLPSVVGTKHLKLSLKQQNSPIFESIGFGLGEYIQMLQPNKLFSVCYTIE